MQLIQVLGVVLILDLIWIYAYMGEQYKVAVNSIQGGPLNINLLAAVLAYLAVATILYMCKKQGMSLVSMTVIGFLVYAVYAMTNKAIFKNFKWDLAVKDCIWGGLLFLSTSLILNLFV